MDNCKKLENESSRGPGYVLWNDICGSKDMNVALGKDELHGEY